MRTQNLIHPGEILQEEFLKPLGISQTRLALDLHVPAPRINAIVRGKRAITADTALRLGQYFKMEPQFWLNLQSNYDLGVASRGVCVAMRQRGGVRYCRLRVAGVSS